MPDYNIFEVGFDKTLQRGSQENVIPTSSSVVPSSTGGGSGGGGSIGGGLDGGYGGGLSDMTDDVVNPQDVSSGVISGELLMGDATAPLTGIGIFLGLDDEADLYKARFGDPDNDYFLWDGANISITGTVTATAGAIGGWSITATTIQDAAGVVGMSSAVTGGDDIRFWAGHATPASAPFYVTEAGALVATSATITGDITATSGYFTNVTLGKTGVASGTLTLELSDGTGDTYIASGKTGFTNVDAGFIIGLDDDDSNLAKFYIGDSSTYFNWDGSAITVAGGVFNAGALNNALTLGDGSTTSGRLTLNVTDGQGDSYINAGKTDFTNSAAGFIVGIDDSDANTPKFYIGDTSQYLNWTGSALVIAGAIVEIDTSTGLIKGEVEDLMGDIDMTFNGDGTIATVVNNTTSVTNTFTYVNQRLSSWTDTVNTWTLTYSAANNVTNITRT